MQVVLADRDEAALKAVAQEIGNAAYAVPTDVTDPAALEALAEKAWAAHGQVDLLFNNAGVLSTGFCWEIPAEKWQQVIDVNLTGVVNGLRAFVPRLLAAGRPAHIVNTASVGGFLPSPLMSPYSATKFAVVALTESLAGELKMLGAPIAVSLLAPGPVKSQIFRENPPESAQQFHQFITGMLDENGLSADQFAPLVLDAVERGDYWIFPQPEALEPRFSNRNAAILAGKSPEFFSTEEQAQ
jgi:NADP-dependent 3-hydroxy acid dehydrogenase YdfG